MGNPEPSPKLPTNGSMDAVQRVDVGRSVEKQA
jgi:hypothetical protein